MGVVRAKSQASAGRVVVVGMGMSPEDLSVKALSLIDEADLLIGGRRHLSYFSRHSAQKVAITNNLDEIVSVIKSFRNKKKVVILASGDPGYFGIASYLVSRLGKEKVEIIPNVTSFQAAFAKIKERWDDACLISLHGRTLPRLAPLVRKHRKVGLLTDNVNTPRSIARRILSEDASLQDTTVFVVEGLGTLDERVHECRLKSLVTRRFSPLNVMIFISPSQKGERQEETVQIGIPDNLFSHPKGFITKEDVRVFTLAKLTLPREGVLWDIGSGSGSIAIESARLAPELIVYAVEKDKQRFGDLRRNIEKFHMSDRVIPIQGEAPFALNRLPQPHRVFIGGTGGNLLSILRYCRRALPQSGKIVINAVTMETVNGAISFFEQFGWYSAVTLVSVAKMKRVGDQRMFHPFNPVFIIEGSTLSSRAS